MTPSWYDLLDVEPGATPDEIRGAWRRAIDGLDPTDRRFAIRNQAAAVLLDVAKRQAYDAELAAESAEAAEATEAGDADGAISDEGPATVAVTPAPAVTTIPVDVTRAPKAARPAKAPASTSVVTELRRPIPGWLLVGLGVVTAIVAALAGFLYSTSDSTTEVADSATAAQASAEKAIVPVFSYDYRHLAADKATAESYMTDSYRDYEFEPFFKSVIEENATRVKPVATATFLDSAVTIAQADQVDVLVFFNITSTNAAASDPLTQHNYATLRMKLVDGDWLINQVITKPVGG